MRGRTDLNRPPDLPAAAQQQPTPQQAGEEGDAVAGRSSGYVGVSQVRDKRYAVNKNYKACSLPQHQRSMRHLMRDVYSPLYANLKSLAAPSPPQESSPPGSARSWHTPACRDGNKTISPILTLNTKLVVHI